MITEGRDICDESQKLPSHLYCVSRVFWSKDNGKTNICWNTSDPFFQFQQVTPASTDPNFGEEIVVAIHPF